MKNSKSYFLALIAALSLTIAADVMAQTATVSGKITRIRTAWLEEAFALDHSAGTITPGGCTPSDGYASSASTPGYKVLLQTALLAFAADKPVVIIVSANPGDCSLGRPKIIGINVSRE